ncbi:hypothetical protein AHAS_Ahas12G0243500 [Arachis hypogaea]
MNLWIPVISSSVIYIYTRKYEFELRQYPSSFSVPLHFAFISTCYFVRIMENHQTMSEKFEKFTWTINNNFYVLVEFEKYQFVFGGYSWSISVGIDENRLMVFILEVVDWIQGHSITTNFKFSFVNQRVDTLVKSIAIDGQNLWEELEYFVFDDLTLLENSVKIYAMEKLKENMNPDRGNVYYNKY